MWHLRGRIFTTKDPNLIITAVQYFPNINTDYKIYQENNNVKQIQEDLIYRELMAYYYLVHGGRDFIPLYFEDKCPKLAILQNKYPLQKSMFWCIGYVSNSLQNTSKALLRPSKSINTPDLNTLLAWLKYYCKNYSDNIGSGINRALAEDYLRKYVIDNSKDIVDYSRRFSLIYNCSTIFTINRDYTVNDWINHLENLPNRSIYEIMINDFK